MKIYSNKKLNIRIGNAALRIVWALMDAKVNMSQFESEPECDGWAHDIEEIIKDALDVK